MIKKRLKDHLSRSDYSIFDVDHTFKKYHLKEIQDDTGTYHSDMCREAVERLKILGNLTLDEYFQYIPNEVDRLSDLPSFSKYDDIGDMRMIDFFNLIGSIGQTKELVDAVCILMEPIVDSNFDHPLYRSSVQHILNACHKLTGDDHCTSKLDMDLNMKSMNDFLQIYIRKCGMEGCYPHFFNCIIIPSLCLRSTEDTF